MIFGHIPGKHLIYPTVYSTTKNNLDVVIWLDDLVTKPHVRVIAVTEFANTAEWRAKCAEIRDDIEESLQANGRLGDLTIVKGRGVRIFKLSASNHGRQAQTAVSRGYVWNSADRCVDVEQTRTIWFGLLKQLSAGNDASNLWVISQFGPMDDPPIPELTNEVAFTKLRVLG